MPSLIEQQSRARHRHSDYMTGRATVNIAVKTAWGMHCSGVQRDSLGDPLFATRGQWRRRASDSDETPPIDLLELEELT